MKITCLGTGSPEANARRASSGYLVEAGNDRILLDCGGGVVGRLVESGRKPSDITHLFFSHLHSDHMMDYARLMHAAWDESGKTPSVFGPAPIAGITEKLFGNDGVFAHDLAARTQHPGSRAVWKMRGGELPRPLPKPQVFEIPPNKYSHDGGGWRLSSCEVPHAQPFLQCMAFRVESEGKVFVYSGDAAICPQMEQLSAGADLLVHWCYRLDGEDAPPEIAKVSPTPRDIAQMAARAKVKRLLLTHLRTNADTPENHSAMLAAMQESFNGGAGIAEDLMEINL